MRKKVNKELEGVFEKLKESDNYILCCDKGILMVNGNLIGLTTLLNITIREMLKRGVPKIMVDAAIDTAYKEAKTKRSKHDKEILKDILECLDEVFEDEE